MKFVALILTLLAPAVAMAETHRIAVLVGSNAGNGDLPPLRWAETDAGKLARTLLDVGQISPGDLFLLQGRQLAEIEKTLALAQARIAEAHRSPDSRVLLIFFFSGHSDGEALEVGAERLSFARLHKLLADSGAEVRVSIIDACRSGAAIQEKGGKPAPGFAIRLADDLAATGEAILTSSAADEVALESKEVMGSYFTHHLVSGLRGAADVSGDGQVTLAEAYRYAYDHTLSATAATLNGAQHPTYDLKLSGQGELVLSSFARGGSSLELPAGFDRALVTDLARDQVVAELAGGSARRLALSAGQYGVRAFRSGAALGGRFTLAAGQARAIGWDELKPLEVPKVARKGPEPEVERSSATAEPVLLTLLGGAGSGVGFEVGPSFRIAAQLLGPLELSLAGTTGSGAGANGSFEENSLQARAGLGWERAGSRLALRVEGELGMGYLWQTFQGKRAGGSLSAMLAPRLGLRLRLAGPFFVAAEAETAIAVAKVDGSLAPFLLPSALVGLGMRL